MEKARTKSTAHRTVGLSVQLDCLRPYPERNCFILGMLEVSITNFRIRCRFCYIVKTNAVSKIGEV